MQCSIDEDGAVVKQRKGPMDEAAVMHRYSHEDKAMVMQGRRTRPRRSSETMMRRRRW